MTSVPNPVTVFSEKEIKRIKKWVAIYQNPILFFYMG